MAASGHSRRRRDQGSSHPCPLALRAPPQWQQQALSPGQIAGVLQAATGVRQSITGPAAGPSCRTAGPSSASSRRDPSIPAPRRCNRLQPPRAPAARIRRVPGSWANIRVRRACWSPRDARSHRTMRSARKGAADQQCGSIRGETKKGALRNRSPLRVGSGLRGTGRNLRQIMKKSL